MATFRINKEENFVQIHKTPIMDQRLSFKAKGILMYLLSRPNDWQVYEVEVVKHSKDGRDSVRSGIKELIKNGYITRHESRDNNGRFKGYDYEVYEIPHRVGKSDNGNSNIGQSHTTNNKVTNINKTKNEKRYLLTSKQDRLLNFYNECFKEKFGKDHPTLTGEQLDDMEYHMENALTDMDMDAEHMEEVIEEHFNKLPAKNDGKINAFLKYDGMNYGVLCRYVL